MDAGTIGQIITFLSVLVGFAVQYLRETRQHRWDSEERLQIAAKVLLTNEVTAIKLAAETARTEARLTQHISDNTEISKVAFKEANDVNQKIQALGLDSRLMKPAHAPE